MSDVIHSVDGSIWQVEIDRPERANALRRRTIRQIEAVLDAAEAPESDAARETGPDARGVLLTGGLERFSAGADLSELNGPIDDLGFDDGLERLCRRLTLSPLPVVAAVEGACYGAAVDLAWACDTVVVSDEARLASPARRGALEARRAAIRKDQNECSPGAASGAPARDRGHDAHGGAVVDGGAESVEEAHVVVADEHVDEPAELA